MPREWSPPGNAMENSNRAQLNRPPLPDVLIAWTTAGALIAFGIMFFDDAVIMGRTVLLLGLLSAGNELLKLFGLRTGLQSQSYRMRLILAVVYVTLVLIGFVSPGSQP